MNNRIDGERCMSTASTVSGIYSNLLPSPAPVCMFYFAHPFGGIATPSSTSYSIDPYAGMPTAEKVSNSKYKTAPNQTNPQHLNDFTPWPRQTWQSRDLLSPLIQALQKQIGQNISDFEKVLRTIRELWCTPHNNNNNNNIADVQYLHNYYSFVQRQKQLNEQNFDYILNWQENLNYVQFIESNAFSTNEMMMTHSNRRIDKQPDAMGFAVTMQHNKLKKPHTGLLRRRHSLPEIIMRKHQLATQKHVFTDMNASTAPSPPARERIPPSFESRERTRTSSPYSTLTSSPSTIIANGFASSASTGSDPNLSRMFPTNGSMRQQLLRRLWHKEYRRSDRTGSLSPPLHRSLRTKRALKVQDTRPEVCLECQKLEVFNRSVPEIAMKHTKHITSNMSKNSTSISSFALSRKSYSVETETFNEQSMISVSSASSGQKLSPPIQSNTSNTATTKDMEIASAASMLNQMNGNFTAEDHINGNSSSSQADSENSFFIEMDGDNINVTTMAAAQSTAISDSTLQMSSNESSIRNLDLTISQTSHWSAQCDDGNNNNQSNSKMTEIGHMRGGAYDAYHMSSGEFDIGNESVVRLKTHEPLDQSAIDTIISQILVDSLNNIIVVQGKGHQSDSNGDKIVELSTSQTQTEHITMDESGSNGSASLPLHVTDQVYFPHYLSTETLSEYSTKLSDNSSAIDMLPSNLVISVISGSAYPEDGGETVVHRLTDMSRTESMEVQPSSAPSMQEDDENGKTATTIDFTKTATTMDDDDANSLVDSLDDPNAVANIAELDVNSSELKVIEKGQAFFVPIESDANSEIVPNSADTVKFGMDAPIANTMPDRLRERLEKRQLEITERKEAEAKRRQEKIQKLISLNGNNRSNSDGKVNTSSFEVISDESSNVNKKTSKIIANKGNSKQLKSDIGSLESYTVDAQGNLKFVEASKKSNGTKKITTISGPVVKHVAIKKTITTNKPLATTKKTRECVASDKGLNEKRTKISTITTKYKAKDVTCQKTPKDVQKMTLGQHSPSDMITPDRDCGPRRMYQKTEIREGAKRIEILEIVECMNSSPENLNPSQSSSFSPPTDSSQCQSLIERYSAKHSSKIPVPVLSKNKSRRSLLNGNQQRTLKAQFRDSVGGTSINNSKVDQFIADLLIEALNHSTDIGIEFIKTPQNPSCQSNLKLTPAKRMSLHSRRSNAIGSNGKRSAHSSAKYQQVFDSIPEEKSGSQSYESPSDENSTTSPVDRVSTNPAEQTTGESKAVKSSASSSSPSKCNGPSKQNSFASISNGNQMKVASGKAAIESDQDKSETWFGCFGRTHVDSPVDGLLMEEESKPLSGTHDSVVSSTSAPTEANTAVSTAISTVISSIDTKDSALTSIPSEAPVREVESVGSDSILPLIDETYENSVAANRGGDAAKDRPFRKHARCSAQNHFDAPCSECESIENNLKEDSGTANEDNRNTIQPKLNANDETVHLLAIKPSSVSTSNENVWQVAHLDKYDTMGKFTLSPITVCSAKAASTLTNNSSIKFGVDSTSFIVLHDENENTSRFLPNITGNDSESNRNGAYQNTFDRPCEDCCFCNPSLHHKHRNDNETPKKCNFCTSRQQSTQTTPATSIRNHEKVQSTTNNDSSARSSIPMERFYESKYRSNHTYIRTHSKDSDTVNTQCTKKTNKKVRRTLLNGSDDRLNANANANANAEPSRNKSDDPNGNEINGNKSSKQRSSIPKLPPATSDWITNSTESATSPSSSNSTGSSTKSNRRHDSKSVPNLPRTERWQNTESSPNVKPSKTRTNSRYQNFYGNGTNSATDERTAVTSSESKSKSKPTGWTVTVAGTYSDDMAPDVQMHLSFPKRASSQSKTIDKSTHIRSIEMGKHMTETEPDTNSNYNDTDRPKPETKPAILPPPTPQSIKLNPKRSLTKNYYNTDLLQQQQQHSQLVSHRKFSIDSNGNANIYQRSAKDYLPHINERMSNHRLIAKQTAKKTFKRSEYSVSVASATTTTRTISNFANGKRAMSIQALNANSFQRFQNGNRRALHGRRDHSADIGQPTYRLSATPSPLHSSSFYSPNTIGYDDDDDTDRNGNHRSNLSVFGNAIAPEQKPRVPTMSERDVTRRHDACFTRTRSIFL